MIEINLGHIVTDISEGMCRSYLENSLDQEMQPALITSPITPAGMDMIIEKVADSMQSRFLDLCRFMRYSGYKTPETARILDAHGHSDDSNYWYANGDGLLVPVKDWIARHDGKYDLLFITSCNPQGLFVKPARSFVVYPLTAGFTSMELLKESNGYPTGNLAIMAPENYWASKELLNAFKEKR